MAIGLPFVFLGPTLLFYLGMPRAQRGEYLWLAVSILIMAVAAFFCVRGLLRIISSFFDGPDEA